jgi:hypothetical protein
MSGSERQRLALFLLYIKPSLSVVFHFGTLFAILNSENINKRKNLMFSLIKRNDKLNWIGG